MPVTVKLKRKYLEPGHGRHKSPSRSSSKDSSLSRSERRRQRYKHGAVTPARFRNR